MSSNYSNPLDNFRSFSYHFILTAASSTEAFRNMIGDGGKSLLSAIHSKKLGEEFSVGNQKAFLVVDTRRFSQYSIVAVDMEHIYGSGDKLNPSVPANVTKVKLIDSTGLTFFNFMMDLMRNKLQTTRASAFFLLSVLFVGHRDDGTTETISTCHIPLVLLLMGFEFTSRGSEYDIEFMEIAGAPQNGGSLSQINFLGDIRSTVTLSNGSNTVGEMIDNLEEQLNKQSLQFYQEYTNLALKKTNKVGSGKLVQYMITVPDDKDNPWRNFKISTAAKSQNSEQTFIHKESAAETIPENSAQGKQSQISFAPTTTITDAIKMILESSKEFTDLASTEKRRAGLGKLFKTITSITCDDSTYVIHFDVFPYIMPKLDANTNSLNAGSNTRKVIGDKNSIKNLITYDYIFTGKNSHITDLKIQYNPESAIALDTNVEFGSAKFASVAALGQDSSNLAKGASTKTAKSIDFEPLIRSGDPIFISAKSKDQLKNNTSQKTEDQGKDKAVQSFKSIQEYNKSMAVMHFLSSITLDMSIRGNPNIIKKYADSTQRGGIAPHEKIISKSDLDSLVTAQSRDTAKLFDSQLKSKIANAKSTYVKTFIQPKINAIKSTTTPDQLLNDLDIALSPIFVKLNILAPDVDWAGNFINPDKLFSNKFFFNGAYQIMFIKTTLSNGEFTHVMTMIPYDTSGEFTMSGDN